jgi:predicted MFS family arabinose efflux permease
MPASLLTPSAAYLSVSERVAGKGIAVFGAFAVLNSLSIYPLANTLNHKTLLLGPLHL